MTATDPKLVEVVFKGERRAVYRNTRDLPLKTGDTVIVEAERGHDMGRVSITGELVKLKKGERDNGEPGPIRAIIRIAEPRDKELVAKNRAKEKECYLLCKEKQVTHNLDMKLVDVEMQHDGSKITFFFTASQRVDFRELVKELAGIYRTRIELRQIGVRDEAKRIGGLGICGRPLCCNSFLNEFEQITTQLAKDQQLSLNPTKISGNCGRLLCCLKYEEEDYLKVLAHFPQLGSRLKHGGKMGTFFFVNVFEQKGNVRFEDGTFGWLTPEEITTGCADA